MRIMARISLEFLMVAGLLLGAQTSLAQDADGDGVSDLADAFPCDAARASVSYFPSAGASALVAFEDQWPGWTDLDFNDVALRVHYRMERSAAGHVVSMVAVIDPVALGGTLSNGLALQLPVARGGVVARRRVGHGAFENLALEADGQATVVLSSSLRELYGHAEGRINSEAGVAHAAGQRLEVELTFSPPAALSMAAAPFDLFIFRTGDFSHQIHFPQYAGTAAMNGALFGTDHDGSQEGRRFVHASGVPAALNLMTTTRYPLEGARIDELFPDIVGFASSGGAQNQGFYTSTIVAARGHHIPALPVPAPAEADRSCIQVVPLSLSPAQVLLAPGAAQTFTASGGQPPYGFSVVSGGGAFAGATYTAPASGSTAVVRVTDGSGATATANVTLNTGSVAFTTAGTHTWTVPAGITTLHAVVVGGGGGGAFSGGPDAATSYGGAVSGGGGGGLSYRNSIAVSPGDVLTIQVGAGGASGFSSFAASGDGGDGATSLVARGGTTFLSATGGRGGRINNTASPGGVGSGGTANRSGGAGAPSSSTLSPGGGGGAAGYSGNGGAAAPVTDGTGGAGAGGGGGGGSSGFNGHGFGGGAGGGVGLFGIGANGAGGVYTPSIWSNGVQVQSPIGGGGGGGSSGGDGGNSTSGGGGSGGLYGGGGAAGRKHPSAMSGWRSAAGGRGAVRIIWGSGRSFPSNAN